MAKQPVTVRFLEKHRPYNAGEIAGFDPDSDLFRHIIQRRLAVVVPQDEVNQMRAEKAEEERRARMETPMPAGTRGAGVPDTMARGKEVGNRASSAAIQEQREAADEERKEEAAVKEEEEVNAGKKQSPEERAARRR